PATRGCSDLPISGTTRRCSAICEIPTHSPASVMTAGTRRCAAAAAPAPTPRPAASWPRSPSARISPTPRGNRRRSSRWRCAVPRIAAIELPDLEAERDDEDQDRPEGCGQPAAAESKLGDAFRAGAIDRFHHLHAVGEDRLDGGDLEPVHLGPRQRQLRAGLAQGELLVADLDAGIPDPPNQGAGVVDLCLQPRDAGAQRVRGGGALVAGVAREVTPGARAAGPGGQHLVRRGGHGVIAVALDAPLVEDR